VPLLFLDPAVLHSLPDGTFTYNSNQAQYMTQYRKKVAVEE